MARCHRRPALRGPPRWLSAGGISPRNAGIPGVQGMRAFASGENAPTRCRRRRPALLGSPGQIPAQRMAPRNGGNRRRQMPPPARNAPSAGETRPTHGITPFQSVQATTAPVGASLLANGYRGAPRLDRRPTRMRPYSCVGNAPARRPARRSALRGPPRWISAGGFTAQCRHPPAANAAAHPKLDGRRAKPAYTLPPWLLALGPWPSTCRCARPTC